MHIEPNGDTRFESISEVITAFRATCDYIGVDNPTSMYMQSIVRIAIQLERVPTSIDLRVSEQEAILLALSNKAFSCAETCAWLRASARAMLQDVGITDLNSLQLVQ